MYCKILYNTNMSSQFPTTHSKISFMESKPIYLAIADLEPTSDSIDIEVQKVYVKLLVIYYQFW